MFNVELDPKPIKILIFQIFRFHVIILCKYVIGFNKTIFQAFIKKKIVIVKLKIYTIIANSRYL